MNKISESRRGFLKKTIYKTPALFVLGSMGKGVTLYADASGGPAGPPGGFFGGIGFKKSSRRKPRKRLRFWQRV